jgi:hypothetical protein
VNPHREGDRGARIRHAARGGVAGCAATVVMTAAIALQLRLSGREFAPKRVTEGVAHRVGVDLDGPVLAVATAVNHLAYGTALGAVYGVARGDRRGGPPGPVAGIAFGIVVWLVSYAGWIPALRIMPSPTRDDPDRIVPVHVAHWIYGATLGAVEDRLHRTR